MIVGPSGPNAERVTAALEQARVKVVRVGSSPVACEKLAGAMPQVVILIARELPPLKHELEDRASAVGALVMEVDEQLDGDAYEDIVNDIITTAITRKMERDEVAPKSSPDKGPPSVERNAEMLDGDEVDDGWED